MQITKTSKPVRFCLTPTNFDHPSLRPNHCNMLQKVQEEKMRSYLLYNGEVLYPISILHIVYPIYANLLD